MALESSWLTMRVKISKTKNAENFYIIKSTYVNKKHSTKIVEKLGNFEEVKLKVGAKDPYLWAKEYALQSLDLLDSAESKGSDTKRKIKQFFDELAGI